MELGKHLRIFHETSWLESSMQFLTILGAWAKIFIYKAFQKSLELWSFVSDLLVKFYNRLNMKSLFFERFAFKQTLSFESANIDGRPSKRIHRDFCSELAILRENLTRARGQTGQYESSSWTKHTNNMCVSKFLFLHIKKIFRTQDDLTVEPRLRPNHPPLLTRAWLKFYEIISNFNILECDSSEIKILFLCEGNFCIFTSLLESIIYVIMFIILCFSSRGFH